MLRLFGPGAIVVEVAEGGLLCHCFVWILILDGTFLASRVRVYHEFVLECKFSPKTGSYVLP